MLQSSAKYQSKRKASDGLRINYASEIKRLRKTISKLGGRVSRLKVENSKPRKELDERDFKALKAGNDLLRE